MTNRHTFEVLATTIRDFVPDVRKGEAATRVATALENECERFNRERFLALATQPRVE